MIAGHLALIIAGVFTAAAVYVNVVEQPARLQRDDRAFLAEWQQRYKRGFAMQAPLAILAGLFCQRRLAMGLPLLLRTGPHAAGHCAND
jgi:hypothetical protein